MSLRTPAIRAPATVALLSLLVGSCGGSGHQATDPTDPGSGPWAFRASLIDPTLILKIKPLGKYEPQWPLGADRSHLPSGG